MPSTFSKNAVISGDVDYYCLVCDDKLKTDDSVNAHIQKVIHKKNLDQKSSYVKDNENERIRKVNKGYYCEYCNVLLTSSLKISFHIKHKNHEYNKCDDSDVTSINKHAKRYENCIIVLDHLLVTEKAWNGLIDNNCAYCNIEFDNEELHKMDSTHILNLIQAQLLIGENRSVYRKVDNHTFHCITCNEVLPLPPELHFEQSKHDECYIQCRRAKKAVDVKEQKNTPITDTLKKLKLNESLSQKEEATKLQARNADECNNTNSTASVTSNESETHNHRAPELDPLEALAKKLDLKDYIYINEKGEPLCILCEWDLSSSMTPIEKHIQGRHHQEILKLHKQRIEKNNREKTNCGDQRETVRVQNDIPEPRVKENNSKESVIINDYKTVLTETDIETTNKTVQSTDNTDILENISFLQKHGIAIDFICEKALCKKCNKPLPFEMEVIRNHIKQHSSSETKDFSSFTDENEVDGTKLFTRPVFVPKSGGNLESSNVVASSSSTDASDQENSGNDATKFAFDNHINYSFSSKQAYCRICKTKIPNGLTSMKEHVKGSRHTRNTPELNVNVITAVVSEKPYRTTRFQDFIESLGKVENAFQEILVLNKKFCISSCSFHIITRTVEHSDMRCHVCEKSFHESIVNDHLFFGDHRSLLFETPVIIFEETEFIRIPRDGVYHCGFCNLIFDNWSDVQNHLKSLTHRSNKMQSDWVLEEFLPKIEVHEMQEIMIKHAIFRALFNNF